MATLSAYMGQSASRLVVSEKIGLKAMKSILSIYEQALQNINQDINELFLKYATESGLDVIELSRVLSGMDKNNFIKDISATMKSLGFKVGDIYSTDYLQRITRLEALKQQIYWEIRDISYKEEKISASAYGKIVRESYNVSRADIREQKGASGTFSTVNTRLVNAMLRENWKGRNFSDSIWGNTTELNAKVQKIVGGGLTSGSSNQKIASQLEDRFKAGKYNSMRLVRTETNHFQNRAELQSYKDENIEYYRYDATLDGRTSDICRELNGKIFKVADAIEGVNYPAMHVNCRSTTTIVFPNEAKEEKVYTSEDAREIFEEVSSVMDIKSSEGYWKERNAKESV